MRLVAALAALALAGCGQEAPKPAAPALSPAQRQVAVVAESFVRALGRHDWKSACSTRSYDDLQALVKQSGTCERAFQIAFKGKDVALVARTVAGRVSIQGDTAGVDMVQRGAKRTVLRLYAVREGGAWRLREP
jgi:hypothetical protein